MNIQQAKEQIKNAMTAYFSKDEYGNYKIPPESQRPVFLMGPPGIGKTAILKQVAGELGVGLVSYSMTHHTRQSALGLPVIREREFQGVRCSVSEYTMSEIIASVYELMEEGGIREGILFLDEINCVSETLTPTMLQFLQYKIFGKHKVPEGWLVVAAGNPPEYNRAARDFDIVTWDRLKRIDIEPDYNAWRNYAVQTQVHPAVLTYLDARKEYFYKLEATPEGRSFVTARSWVDLSDMIRLYEPLNLPVDELLIGQYLQNKAICSDFSLYYDLFKKYRSDYKLEEILAGHAPEDIVLRAKNADFDERLSLMGLLIDHVRRELTEVMLQEEDLSRLLGLLKEIKAGASVEEARNKSQKEAQQKERRGTLTREERRRYAYIDRFLQAQASRHSDFEAVREAYNQELSQLKDASAKASGRLEQLFLFTETCFGTGNELLILLSDLSADSSCARFIARYGSPGYYRHNKELMFYRQKLEVAEDFSEA